MFKKDGGRVLTGFTLRRLGTTGGLLRTQTELLAPANSCLFPD